MKVEDLIFDENLEIYISIEQQSDEICFILSDSLEAIEEDLSIDYKQKIVSFINQSDIWYNKLKNYIANWAEKEYGIITNVDNYVIINIFILFEQLEDEVYGLEYGVDFDKEHNCGLKVKLIAKEYEIFEIGTGDVSFC